VPPMLATLGVLPTASQDSPAPARADGSSWAGWRAVTGLGLVRLRVWVVGARFLKRTPRRADRGRQHACDDCRVTVRPLLISRLACAVPGGAGVVFGAVLLAGSQDVVAVVVSAALIVLGAVVAVRGYRLGVTCRDGQVLVRGLSWSRTVRADRVTELTLFPALRWEADTGRARWTPILAFWSTGGELPFVLRHNEECVDQLARHLFPGQPHHGRRPKPGHRTSGRRTRRPRI